ncbi:hypothetical protein BC628DRAFT_1350172 [Trametes gibbosa]|nr:hypothetical protein BC628DRAFT_1350172 [Trametes gibbosa]
MGSAQSVVSAAAVVAIVSAIAYGFIQPGDPSASTSPSGTQPSSPAVSIKKKQKKKAGGVSSATESALVEPTVVSFPSVVPGGFDAPAEPAENISTLKPKQKKKKSKKASSSVPQDAQSESSATAPESSVARKPRKSATPRPVGADDEGWTRVETKKKAIPQSPGTSSAERPQEISTSDAGITTSVTTGNSSPVTERTEDESHNQLAASSASNNKRTLAEKLLPKPRKTGVEDLLEEPDYPELARVMRIQPKAGERPAAGFSWGDYEDVDETRALTADDADGEDDGGWGVVRSRRSKPKQPASGAVAPEPAPQKASETLTKKQRQHAAKRDAEKAAKAEAEAARLATLAQHKRELERTRMAEQAKSAGKQKSGGMSAYVDENGKLVWQ